ncbi:MAG TPA: alpha/beta fold hydrolase [Pyrinomonadaceae bacterium]|nr:alpha/beta fold hydrolase [Pyrinomonadaceae bacterium]
MKFLIVLFWLIFPVFALGQHGDHNSRQQQAETKTVMLDDGLGKVDHPVSTNNAEAQKFFNQGLAYIYGFNHEEAVKSFRRAAELDANLAQAYWGVSLALGSNYNLTADAGALKEAYANLQKAVALAPKASEIERAYIAALSKRYTDNPQADQKKLAEAYKTAMGELVKKYPDDLDAATLYAESMMNLRPWQLWTLDGKPAEGTPEIISVLESVLRRNPNHTGANHYYIHAVEAGPNPERALASAMRLGLLAPNAGHLVHMPSHIYIRTGDYNEAAKSNADAIQADRRFMQKTGAQGVYTMMYYNHNIHFLSAASAMNGQYAEAFKQARELEANVRPHLKMMPMLEMFSPYALVTLVRFRKWDEIMRYPQPENDLRVTGSFWNFARGLAFTADGKPVEAEKELTALREKIKLIPAETGFGNSSAHGVLKVAEEVLAGEIALARGDRKTAIELLRKAVAAEDAVNYNEPPDWDLPVREWLGRALLINGEYAEAEKVYRDELAKHPRSGRALFGLAEALNKQSKTASAQIVRREFEKAWEKAETKLSVEDLYKSAADNKGAGQTWKFGEVNLKTGIRMHYAEQGDAEGKPVILIHGITDSWFSWSRVLPLLDKKHRVYAVDLRGHGDTDRPERGYAMKDFAADVVAFMDAMKIKKAAVVGHSMGSFVAMQTALDAPERVGKLLIMGTATTARNDVTVDLQKEFENLRDPVDEKFVRDFQVSTSSETVPQEFIDGVVRQSMKLPARVWKAALAGVMAEDYKPRLGKIKAPTLIIWGENENIFPRPEQDILKAKITNSTLKIYPKTGHSPQWEYPEIFARDLSEFLK